MLRCCAPLLITGLVSEGIYLALTLRLPWWRYGGRLHSWPELVGSGWATLGPLLAGILMLIAAYLAGWAILRSAARRRSGPPRQARWAVWCPAVLFALTLLWLQPISSDLFTYLSQAHLFTDLGANPLARAVLEPSAPEQLRDPLLLSYLMPYSASPTVYGPAWILLSSPGTMGRNDVAGGVFYLKALGLLAFLGCAWLLEHMPELGCPGSMRSGKSLESLYLFAWNPLVLLMAVGDGHNDMVMMVFVLLAFWSLHREAWALASGALIFSAWIKFVSIVFLPLFILDVWMRTRAQKGAGLSERARSGRSLAVGIAAALAVTVLTIAPFWPVSWAGGLVQRLLQPANWRGDEDGLSRWALLLGLVLFAVVYLVLVRRFATGEGTWIALADTSFLVALCAFVLGAARSQPWHLIWPAALASLSPRRWAWPVVIGMSALMLVAQIWIEWDGLRIMALSRL